jgi:branched-chain amino acid transport system permease protein
MTNRMRWLWLGLLLFAACALPLPFSSYFAGILVFIGIYSIAATGMGLLIGYAGQLSIGHNAFFGIGAYASAILARRYGISPWLGILSGMIATGLLAYAVSKPILRFRGHMLVIVTVTIGTIFYALAGQMTSITKGGEGFSVPRISIGEFVFQKDIHFYYLVLAILFLCMIVTRNIARSRIGAEFQTIDVNRGGSELAAESLGINTGRMKTQVFVLSAIYTSVAGSLYVHYLAHINSDLFTIWTAFLFVIMVGIGGARSLWGPILGAGFYVGLKELISAVMPSQYSASVAGYEIVIFSLFFVIAMLLFRNGLAGLPALVLKARSRNN